MNPEFGWGNPLREYELKVQKLDKNIRLNLILVSSLVNCEPVT